MSIARERLSMERKKWRQDHPPGFYAKPVTKDDGSIDLFKWECGIPGQENTDWAGGIYKLIVEFSEDYPVKPPKCQFRPLIFHPNIYPSGTVCLSILNEDKDWRPAITIKDILIGIQSLLSEPNDLDPAQAEPFKLFTEDLQEYNKKIREQALRFKPK